MKSRSTGVDFNAGVETLNRRLMRNLGLLVLSLAALSTGVVVYFDQRLLATLSVNLIRQSLASAQQEMANFFEPVDGSLRVAIGQLGKVDLADDDVVDRLFQGIHPFVREYDRVEGLLVADMKGYEYFLMESGEVGSGELRERFISGEKGKEGVAHWRRWSDGEVVERWQRQTDYRSESRPWFQGAVNAELNQVHWTQPYIFFTSKQPGITASSRWTKPDTGEEFVVALDVTLTDISRFTTGLRPTANGQVVVFTDDERVVGLPAEERFEDERAFQGALLGGLEDLKLTVLDRAVSIWKEKGRTDQVFALQSEGATWWAGFTSHEYTHGDENRLWAGVLIPESDFLSGIAKQRNLALSVILGAGVLAAVAMVLTSLRRIRQQLRQTVSQIESKLGQYRLQYKIGDGGNGAVYRARHALLRRPTAIKIMRPEFARSESAKARFEHEVQITAGLTHPNTVAIFDYGQTPEGTLYYAMEYLTGFTLDDLVRIKGPLSPARVLHVLEQVCGSLAEAHGKGLIHRDVKPANIMLCERGGLYDVVKVLDFGLVKESGEDDPGVTQTNVLVGTPQYMAPEIISAPGQASPKSDLYAVGAVAYFLLTGHNVFDGASTVEICAMHLHDHPVPPSQRTADPLPADLEAIVLECLQKDPSKRPGSAAALGSALQACEQYGSWSLGEARHWWIANEYALPLGVEQRTHTPLSNTQLMVDMDDRLAQLRRTAG
jgi:hypothetical protein